MTGVYKHDGAYAREHGELALFRESLNTNMACVEAITEALAGGYNGGEAEALEVEFGAERLAYVLANTVQGKAWDERFSKANKEWAATVEITHLPDGCGGDRTYYFIVDRAHPCYVNELITDFRERLEV